jgi:hypothetical protein
MKILNTKNIFVSAALGLLLLVFGLTSCEQDRCKVRGTTCLNAGVCNNGVCSCIASFEGDSCQYPVNKKFENKYGGYRQIGYRTALGFDTVYVVPDTFFVYAEGGTNDKVRFFSVFNTSIVHNAVIRQNELTTTDTSVFVDKFNYRGKGALNGKLLYIDFDRDSMVGGVSFKNYRITLAGSKILP